MRIRTTIVLVAAAAAVACGRYAAPAAEDITGTTWTLVELYGAPVDSATVSRPATLLLDGAGRASGHSGCNQFGGPYTIDGSNLTFGAIAMTQMACERGMAVERKYATVFEAARTWQVADRMLVLTGTEGRLAQFRR